MSLQLLQYIQRQPLQWSTSVLRLLRASIGACRRVRLSSTSRKLCRASSCGGVHLSRSCCELVSPTPAGTRGGVHFSSTNRKSCRASSCRGPHVSSPCSVCRASSSGGARQSRASCELRHSCGHCVCRTSTSGGVHQSRTSSELCRASSCNVRPVGKHISPAPAMSYASPAPTVCALQLQ